MAPALVLLAALAAPDAGVFAPEPLLPGKPWVLRGHTDGVQAIAFNADGSRLASVGRDKTVRVWDPRTGAQVTLVRLDVTPSSVAFSPDGGWLAVGSSDLQVQLINLADAKVTQTFPHPNVAASVAFSPDGARLAVGGAGDVAGVFVLAKPETRRTFPGRSVAWTGDGRSLLVASGSGEWSTVDPATGKARMKSVRLGSDRWLALASGDGQRVVTWLPMGPDVKLWTAAGRAQGAIAPPPPSADTIEPRRPLVTAVALARDGKRLLVASADGLLRLWSLERREQLAAWPVDNAPSVALSPDGAWIAAVDGALVKLWQAP
jgi:DNA-binding beta-propeller fold protein YncE